MKVMAHTSTPSTTFVHTQASKLNEFWPTRFNVLACIGLTWLGCSPDPKSTAPSSGPDVDHSDHDHSEHADIDHGSHSDDHHDGHSDDEHGGHGGGHTDTGGHHGGMGGDPPPPKEEALPDKLSEAGLYSDIISKTIDDDMLHYVPQFQLWSDAADKERWAYIPEGRQIDTADMNNWSVPVGSRFFKEFSIDGKRIETRLIERVGEGPRDFAFVSYLWNADQTEATKVGPEGLPRALGTSHDVPSKLDCLRCHGTHPLGGGRPSRMLGFSAIQLSHAETPVTVSDLADRLSHPIDAPYVVPGDPTAQAALGYLHANCGNCHNDESDRVPQVDLSLWLNVEDTTVEATSAWKTAVSQGNALFNDQHVIARIAPGNAEESAIIYRMSQRGNTAQMPPVATKEPDATGIAVVTEWIRSLP